MPRLTISRFGLLLGGLMALLAAFAVTVETVGTYEDEGVYESTAQSLVDGKGYRIATLPGSPPNAKYPFLYPAWLAVIKWIVPGSGAWEQAVLKLSNIPILMAFVWIFYRTLRDRFGWPQTACQLTAALTGICGTVLPFSLVMMTEIPFMLVIWILLREVMLVGDGPQRPRWWLVLAMGAAAYYLRTAGVAILAAVLLFLWMRGLRRKTAFLLVGWGLAALPWVIWSRHASANFSASEPLLSKLLAYYLSYDYHTGALLEAARDDGWTSAAGFAATIVIKNVGTLIEGLGEVFFPIGLIYAATTVGAPLPAGLADAIDLFIGGAGILAAVFIVAGYRGSRIANKSLLGLAMVFHVAMFVVWPWPFAGRFLTPIVPLLVLFAAESLMRWSEHTRIIRAAIVSISLLLQVWTLAALFPGGTIISRVIRREEPAYHEAVQWLKPRLSGNDVVFSGLTSQWVGRELGSPVVRYNTVLSPKTGLKLQFKIDPESRVYADEYAAGLREWKKVAGSRSGHLVIFAEIGLDHLSWQALENQMLRNELKVAWTEDGYPVRIFEVAE